MMTIIEAVNKFSSLLDYVSLESPDLNTKEFEQAETVLGHLTYILDKAGISTIEDVKEKIKNERI